ncbi:MAG: Lrp/AsnC family transcriptional regulator [Dehalococcoidia bacterium]
MVSNTSDIMGQPVMGDHNDPLDELDLRIIHSLRTDARRTNTDLAKELGVSEGTIRNRIRRLISEGYMIVVAMMRAHKLGLDTDVGIDIVTEAGKQMEVAQRLSAMEATRYVALVTGTCDLKVAAVFRNNAQLYDWLVNEFAHVPGIVSSRTSHTIRTLKRVHDWVIYEEEENGETND